MSFLQVPDDFLGEKSQYLPLATSTNSTFADSSEQFSQCDMYISPKMGLNASSIGSGLPEMSWESGKTHSETRGDVEANLQPCIHGYEFHFEDDEAWNIIAEVS